MVLGQPLEDFRVLAVWVAAPTKGPLMDCGFKPNQSQSREGSMRLLQFEEQLQQSSTNWSWAEDLLAPKAKKGILAPLVELWNHLVAGGRRIPRLPTTIPRA